MGCLGNKCQSLYIFQTNGYSARRVRGKSEANSRGAREKRERRDKHQESSMNNITFVSFFFPRSSPRALLTPYALLTFASYFPPLTKQM